MAYVGNPVDTQNTFQSLVGKRFSGDGSETEFTLDVAPSSTLDIEVFVGNVRQDPNSAYTLSGTTLTFTGAPPSGTNNIYVGHQAKSVGTIDPPSNITTAQTFSGAVTASGGLTSSGTTTVSGALTASGGVTLSGTTPTLTIGDAGAEDAKIVFDGNEYDYHIGLDDSTNALTIGRGSALGTTTAINLSNDDQITKPLQSAFLALNDGGDSITNATTTTIALDSEIFDVNGDVSSNTFTAPATGKYFLSAMVRLDAGSSSNTRFNRMFISFNASNRGTLFETGQMYTDEDDRMGVSGSMVLDMDANDTVVLRVFASRNGASGATTTSGHNTEPVTFFSGFLLG